MKTKLSSGQTILEVVFVMVLITTVLTSFIYNATRSLRTTTQTLDRSQATKYAQEGMEFVRKLRDNNWSEFKTYGFSWRCPSTSSTWAKVLISNPYCSIDGTVYKWRAEFLWDTVNKRMTVRVIVVWTDSTGDHKSELTGVFAEPINR